MKHVIIFTDCGDTLVDESKQDFIDRERCLVRSAGLIEGAREELVDLKEHGFRVAMVADGLVESFDNIVAQHGLDRGRSVTYRNDWQQSRTRYCRREPHGHLLGSAELLSAIRHDDQE